MSVVFYNRFLVGRLFLRRSTLRMQPRGVAVRWSCILNQSASRAGVLANRGLFFGALYIGAVVCGRKRRIDADIDRYEWAVRPSDRGGLLLGGTPSAALNPSIPLFALVGTNVLRDRSKGYPLHACCREINASMLGKARLKDHGISR